LTPLFGGSRRKYFRNSPVAGLFFCRPFQRDKRDFDRTPSAGVAGAEALKTVGSEPPPRLAPRRLFPRRPLAFLRLGIEKIL